MLTRSLRRIIQTGLGLFFLGSFATTARPASAQTESFTFSAGTFTDNAVGGSQDVLTISGATTPAGTVTLTSGTMSAPITIGQSSYSAQTSNNAGVSYSGSNVFLPFTLTGAATKSHSLTQAYSGRTSGTDDNSSTIFLTQGSVYTFDFGSQGQVDVRLQARSLFTTGYGAANPQPERVTFLLHDVPAAVPEPPQFAALGMGALGLGVMTIRARRKRRAI